MPDTSVLGRQASFDEVDLQLAVRSVTADNRPSLSSTAPLPIVEHIEPIAPVTGSAPRLLLPGGVLAVAAALLVVAVVSVSHQSAPPPPSIAVPAGSVPAQVVPIPVAPVAPPPVAAPPVAPPMSDKTPAVSPPPAPSVDPAPRVGMPQQRLRHLLTRLADHQ